MRKEIPLLITGFVGIVLILQYFSPNKAINQFEELFLNWMQIVAAFSMILGVLNLVRVNGDKIYKKRRNWGFSVIIILSLFVTLFVGFSNIGSESLYNRKILKTNSGIVGSVAKEVLKEYSFASKDEAYSPLLIALIEGTQKEKTISSILPEKLKEMKLESKYEEMLSKVRTKTKEVIELSNNIGRKKNLEIEKSVEELKKEKFKNIILSLNKKTLEDLNKINKEFSLKDNKTIEENIEEQVKYILNNFNKENIKNKGYFLYYNKIAKFINKFNEFLLNDNDFLSLLNLKLANKTTFNKFNNEIISYISLKEDSNLNTLLRNNILPTYLNLIYREKSVSKEYLKDIISKINKGLLATNEDAILNIVNYIKVEEIKNIKNSYQTVGITQNDLVGKIVYFDMVKKIFSSKDNSSTVISSIVDNYLNSSLNIRKLKTNKEITNKYISANKNIFNDLKISKASTNFILSTLLSTEKYKLATLDNGSAFMEIYRYIFTPLSSTMFALLAFFVASASYRAFRARNKEATILLIAGFLVMLGRVPVGDLLSIEGYFNISEISQFIMEVPAMSVQSAIMIGVALGVISTSLRLILGIERSHLGGD